MRVICDNDVFNVVVIPEEEMVTTDEVISFARKNGLLGPRLLGHADKLHLRVYGRSWPDRIDVLASDPWIDTVLSTHNDELFIVQSCDIKAMPDGTPACTQAIDVSNGTWISTQALRRIAVAHKAARLVTKHEEHRLLLFRLSLGGGPQRWYARVHDLSRLPDLREYALPLEDAVAQHNNAQ